MRQTQEWTMPNDLRGKLEIRLLGPVTYKFILMHWAKRKNEVLGKLLSCASIRNEIGELQGTGDSPS